jgi:hypothetical protein
VSDGSRITHAAALEIADEAVRDHVTIADAAPVRIMDDGEHIVIEFTRPLAAGERGPDYAARVTLDAQTGVILEILSCS